MIKLTELLLISSLLLSIFLGTNSNAQGLRYTADTTGYTLEESMDTLEQKLDDTSNILKQIGEYIEEKRPGVVVPKNNDKAKKD